MFFGLSLTGCGTLANSKTLYKEAISQHGPGTLISSSDTEHDGSSVVIKDELQGFTYSVSSYKADVNFDGANFGSVSSIDDKFESALFDYVWDGTSTYITEYCDNRGIRVDTGHYQTDTFLFLYTPNETFRVQDATFCATLLNDYNQKNRLDNYSVRMYNSEEEFLGLVKLSDMTWYDSEQVDIEYYTEMAQLQLDKNAKFLRAEEKTFADTGAKLNMVVCVLGSDMPDSEDSPVMFYYFDIDGKEYYLCDFNYYFEENGTTFGWYSNYPIDKRRDITH
jgi:flagellar basal body rod protein FlgB